MWSHLREKGSGSKNGPNSRRSMFSSSDSMTATVGDVNQTPESLQQQQRQNANDEIYYKDILTEINNVKTTDIDDSLLQSSRAILDNVDDVMDDDHADEIGDSLGVNEVGSNSNAKVQEARTGSSVGSRSARRQLPEEDQPSSSATTSTSPSSKASSVVAHDHPDSAKPRTQSPRHQNKTANEDQNKESRELDKVIDNNNGEITTNKNGTKNDNINVNNNGNGGSNDDGSFKIEFQIQKSKIQMNGRKEQVPIQSLHQMKHGPATSTQPNSQVYTTNQTADQEVLEPLPIHLESKESHDTTSLAAIETVMVSENESQSNAKAQIDTLPAKQKDTFHKSPPSKTHVIPIDDSDNQKHNNTHVYNQDQQHEYAEADDVKSQSESTISTNPSLYNSNTFQISNALQLKTNDSSNDNNFNREGDDHSRNQQQQPIRGKLQPKETTNKNKNTNTATTTQKNATQIQPSKDFDDIEEENDEFIINEFGNDFDVDVDINIDGDDDAIQINADVDPVQKLHEDSILNATNDHDISYDESVNSTSFSNLKKHYETLLANQKTTHDKHIDDILLQLSSIESTYHDEISTLQKNLSKKEVMCDALTSSLSDYKRRNEELEEEMESYNITCTELEYKLDDTNLQLQESRREIVKLRQQYETLRKSSEQEKKEAISFAEQEIQSQAETQFAIAQKKYVQLKTDYQQNLREKDILEEQFKTLTQQIDSKEKVHKSHISQIQEELNVVRLELSSSRTENQKVKSMLNERMIQLEKNERNLEEQLELKVKECQERAREKHELKRENAELQSLCEELMNIVERGVGTPNVNGMDSGPQNDHSSPSIASRSSRSSRSTSRGL